MVQNEINNLGFLTGEAKTKMSKVNRMAVAFVLYTWDMIDVKNMTMMK